VEIDGSGNATVVLLDANGDPATALDANGNAVSGEGTPVIRVMDGEQTIVVGNEPGKPLPHTGGSGTQPFTLVGTLLVALAGATLFLRRRAI